MVEKISKKKIYVVNFQDIQYESFNCKKDL